MGAPRCAPIFKNIQHAQRLSLKNGPFWTFFGPFPGYFGRDYGGILGSKFGSFLPNIHQIQLSFDPKWVKNMFSGALEHFWIVSRKVRFCPILTVFDRKTVFFVLRRSGSIESLIQLRVSFECMSKVYYHFYAPFLCILVYWKI